MPSTSGFPEVWNLPSILAKQDYLYQNQVERVTFEDLLVATEFRKQVHRRAGHGQGRELQDLGASRVGVEVKYRNSLEERSLLRSAAVAKEPKCSGFVAVVKEMPGNEWVGRFEKKAGLPAAVVPVADFMMLF